MNDFTNVFFDVPFHEKALQIYLPINSIIIISPDNPDPLGLFGTVTFFFSGI